MLGARWHAVTVLANATGHQLSCTFGSVLSFLGTISQQHHHGWGARGKGQNPPVATPHAGFLHLHRAAFWQSSETTLEEGHCQLPARKHSPPSCGGCCRDPTWAALQLLALLLPAGVGTVGSSSWHLCVPTLVLPLGAAQHLQRAQASPAALSNPSAGLLHSLKAFLPPFHFVPPSGSGNGKRQNGVWGFDVLLFSVAFLNVAGDNPNSSSAVFF